MEDSKTQSGNQPDENPSGPELSGNHPVTKFLRYVFYTLFIIGFLWVISQLFFQERMNEFLSRLNNFFVQDVRESNDEKIDHFRIIYPQKPVSLEPTLNDPDVRQVLINLYEPLVKVDKDLTIRSALALSWGIIDEDIWEFKLRPNIVFHDGSSFDVEDVDASISRALFYSESGFKNLLSSIEDIEIIDDLTLRIHTLKPDPLLLQRLSLIFIVPSEYENKHLPQPIGTSSYKFVSRKDDETIELEKFVDYWGDDAVFEKVSLIFETDKEQRVTLFLNGSADALSFVPYEAVSLLQEKKAISLASVPGLEVQFLLFNMKSKFLSDIKARQSINYAIDQSEFVETFGDYVNPVHQFVGNGVFGFNPYISNNHFDLEKAVKLAEESGLGGQTLQFHLLKGLDMLGEYVRTRLAEIGVNVIVSYLDIDDLNESMEKHTADIYFLGFKSELGDASDFLDLIVHSGGEFNIGGYSNELVDELIESAAVNINVKDRRDDIHEVMRIVVEDDVIGVPLFEYENVYAFWNYPEFEPRIDGFIYFDDLIIDNL